MDLSCWHLTRGLSPALCCPLFSGGSCSALCCPHSGGDTRLRTVLSPFCVPSHSDDAPGQARAKAQGLGSSGVGSRKGGGWSWAGGVGMPSWLRDGCPRGAFCGTQWAVGPPKWGPRLGCQEGLRKRHPLGFFGNFGGPVGHRHHPGPLSATPDGPQCQADREDTSGSAGPGASRWH